MLKIKSYVKVKSVAEAYELNQKKTNRIIGGMLWLKMMNINIQTAMVLTKSVELLTCAIKDYIQAILHKYPEIQSNGWTLEHYEDYVLQVWDDQGWEDIDNPRVITMILERFGKICQFGQNHWSSECKWEIVYPALHNWSFYFQSEYFLNCFIKLYIRNPEQVKIFKLENDDYQDLHQEK